MQTDKVSVVIPVYNGMPDIKISITSLKLQTHTNWEAIIIDDGSTDGTAEYIDSLNDERFIVHHFPKNMGRPYARQKALELATGKYLAMLDADDFYAPDKLEKQVRIMEENSDVMLVGAGMCSWGKKSKKIRIRGCGDATIRRANKKTSVAHAAAMLRTNEAKRYGYNLYMQYGQDQDFLQRYLDGRQYVELPDVLYYYSEFDSVNRKKIKRTHWICFKNAFAKRDLKEAAIRLIKLAVCVVTHPFMTDEQILLKRGSAPTEKQYNDFIEHHKLHISKL